MMGIKFRYLPLGVTLGLILLIASGETAGTNPGVTSAVNDPNLPATIPATTPSGMSAATISGIILGGLIFLFVLLIVARFVYECGHSHHNENQDDSDQVAQQGISNRASGPEDMELYEDAASQRPPQHQPQPPQHRTQQHQPQQHQGFSKPPADLPPRALPPPPPSQYDEPMYENMQPSQNYQDSRF